jgi:DNA-3-methyladenine glycosylase I
MEPTRCEWSLGDPLLRAYHDDEWGIPEHDDRRLFELLTLEGAQAGLSWLTILRKREAFRAAFAGFDAERVAGFGQKDVQRLLDDAGIVRNRAKILAAVNNAGSVLAIRERVPGGLDELVWSFAPPPRTTAPVAGEVPASTPESVALSKALRRHGFVFVGPTTAYATMQACGLVDDHLAGCMARDERWGAGR